MTVERVLEAWPEATKPSDIHLRRVLAKGAEDERWERHGKRVRGDPHTFVRMP